MKRHPLGAIVALSLLASQVGPAAGWAGGGTRCLGFRATIVAQRGQKVVRGTPRSDVIVGSRRAEVIRGRGGHDVICGRGGDDVIQGGRGTETIYGGAGDDVLRGGKGAQDWLEGGQGDDRLNGGAGLYDAVRYIRARREVSVNLAGGSATGQGDDVITGGISDVFGSRFADMLVGDDGEEGNGFFPAAGDDEIDGGGGFDLVLYSYAERGVTIDLLNGSATGEGTDSLAGIEGARGSQFADTISGDHAANALYGGRGDDVLAGRNGDDYLHGGRGTDTLDGGEGTDVCVAGESVNNCDAPRRATSAGRIALRPAHGSPAEESFR